MATRPPQYRSSEVRREICRQHNRWPEVRIVGVEYTWSPIALVLSCGHRTRRLRARRVTVDTGTVICEQCAAGDPPS